MSSRDALIVALPATAADAADDAAPPRWWRVRDGRVAQQGWSDEWVALAAPEAGAPRAFLLGIAPAADLLMQRAAFPDLAPRQAEAAARLFAAEASMTPAADLHVAVGAAEADGQRPVVALDAAAMRRWLDWIDAQGLEADAIVPAPALLPAPAAAAGAWTVGDVGAERIWRGRDAAFVDDPMLVAHIVGADASVTEIAPERIDAALAAACDAPPLDLRAGAFARRPARWLTAALGRRVALLVAAILIVSLAIGVARLVRLHSEIAALDAAALADAGGVLRPAPTDVAQALPALDARLAALGGGGGLSAPLAALVAALEPAANVAIDTLQWRGDGTLAVTLGAPRVEDINAVLLALQGSGYVVTAQARAGTDGRALADITIRSSR
jgi:general secretion pathway protein L